MQFVKDGPDVPVEIIQKLEDGKLVLFCGAGVSYPVGLPSFQGLVDKIYELLNEDMEPEELQSYKAKNYDRVLGMLENRLAASSLVRKTIINILYIDPASEKLDVYQSILMLAKFNDGKYRLITTNFDRGFIEASSDENLIVDAAPKLPIPKEHRWNSLVHLHGVISEDDIEGKNLVVTSADFGAAYLTERWASRFVSELFRRYSVLFIGYSVEDPVVRYMMDAFAADRQQGDEQTQQAYVLASSTPKEMEKTERAWKSKSVLPIIYNKKRKHILLHQTLNAWAAIHRDGLSGKEHIVRRYAADRPNRPYGESTEQVVWAISEPNGHIAYVFATLDPDTPPIEWLEVFKDYNLLNKNSPQSIVPLVDNGYRTSNAAELDPVLRNIGIWLSRHLGNLKTLYWVIEQGGCLHHEFRDIIKNELKDIILPDRLRVIWEVICDETNSMSANIFSNYYLLFQNIKNNWNPLYKQQLLYYLEPYVEVGKPWSMDLNEESSDENGSSDEVQRIRDIVDVNVKLRAGSHMHDIVSKINGFSNSQTILAELLDGLTTCLVKAWELRFILEKIEELSDYSYLIYPSISDHDQNRDYDDIAKLIILIRDAFNAAIVLNPELAKGIIERWKSYKFPLFKRLVLYAHTESNFYTTKTSLDYLLEDDAWWLWSVETKREVFRLLNKISSTLSLNDFGRLSNAINEGPPRNMFLSDIDEARFNKISDREKWVLLKKLKQFNSTFDEEANELLSNLSSKYPNWQLRDGDRDEFSTWMESGSGYETDFTIDQLKSMGDGELITKLLDTQEKRSGLLDLWRNFVKQDPNRAIKILYELSERNKWTADIWHASFNGFTGEQIYFESWEKLSPLIIHAPNKFYTEELQSIAYWLKVVTKEISIDLEHNYWKIWDRLIEFAFRINHEDFNDPVSAAINSPIGYLTESILDRIWSRRPKVGIGFDNFIRPRLTKISEGETSSHILARVLLASRLQVLFTIDQEWTKRNLLPYFNWETSSEASFLWEGYLWMPRISPDLLVNIKKQMLIAIERKNELHDHAANVCQLFLISCMEYPDIFTQNEVRKVLKAIDDDGRSEIARSLKNRIAEAGNESNLFWKNRASPWLKAHWPKDKKFVKPGPSGSLALCAINSGSEFDNAIEVVIPLIMRIEDYSPILHILKTRKFDERTLMEKNPKGVLKLLDAIVSDEVHWVSGELREILNEIKDSEPTLIESLEYKYLNNILVLKGR